MKFQETEDFTRIFIGWKQYFSQCLSHID